MYTSASAIVALKMVSASRQTGRSPLSKKRMANKITGANAGGASRLRIRALRAAASLSSTVRPQRAILQNGDNLRSHKVLKRNKKENRMKNKINIESLVVGAALGAAVVFSLGAATIGKKSEYRQVPTQQSDESLNKMA